MAEPLSTELLECWNGSTVVDRLQAFVDDVCPGTMGRCQVEVHAPLPLRWPFAGKLLGPWERPSLGLTAFDMTMPDHKDDETLHRLRW